jgi:4-amino-4-deoxy-L-arabinose transferase-like glycosyltransferase
MIHMLATRTWDLNPPLYFIFAWIGRWLSGNSVESFRWVSLVAGTGSIPLVYLVGRESVGLRAGLVASALVAIDPFMIYFSDEARPFALQVFLCLSATVLLLKALRTGRLAWWTGYAVCICAAMYTQYTSAFLLAAQFVWAFWTYPKARRALLIATGAAAICFLPWVPAVLYQGKSSLVNSIAILDPFGLSIIGRDLVTWSVGAPFVDASSVPGGLGLILVALGLGVALLGLALVVSRGIRSRTGYHLDASTTLVVALALATPVGVALYSSVARSIWEPKDLIASLPALSLLVGIIVTTAPRPATILSLGLLLLGLAVGSSRLLQSGRQRPDYDAAARYVRRVGGATAPIAEVPGFTPGPLQSMEVATRLITSSGERPNPVLRVGGAPLGLVLRMRPGTLLPGPPALVVARDAVRLAVNGKLFLVSLGATSAQSLARDQRLGPASPTDTGLSAFLRNIPARFKLTGRRTFPGFIPVSVYTFSEGH